MKTSVGYPDHDAELRVVTTPGDLSQAPVERIGVGVFTLELRAAGQLTDGGFAGLGLLGFHDGAVADDHAVALAVQLNQLDF